MSDADREQHWRRMAEAGWSLDGRSVRELLARLDAKDAALKRAMAHRDALVAAITEGGYCTLCDWSEVDGVLDHADDCPVRQTTTASSTSAGGDGDGDG